VLYKHDTFKFFCVEKSHPVSNSWKLPLETSTGNLSKTERNLSTPQACQPEASSGPVSSLRSATQQEEATTRSKSKRPMMLVCCLCPAGPPHFYLFSSCRRLVLDRGPHGQASGHVNAQGLTHPFSHPEPETEHAAIASPAWAVFRWPIWASLNYCEVL
jgi:hypothetical protein